MIGGVDYVGGIVVMLNVTLDSFSGDMAFGSV